MEHLIRQLREEDRADWQVLYHSYLAFYETEPQSEATDLVWQKLTSVEPHIQAAVVEVDGALVGLVQFHFQQTTWSQTSYCYLEDLFVDERFRGRGFARALIEHVKGVALQSNCTELFWITRAENATARRLYDKLAAQTDYVRYEINLLPKP